jgi:biopolymer transport protein ExbD
MSLGNLDKAEPNLVPMLDLVLQLVMFFMLCANFLMEDVNAAIKLPSAIQAKPLDKSEDYVVFLNVDKKGHVLLGKEAKSDVLTNAIQVQNYMRDRKQFDDARIQRDEKAGKKGRLSLVVIRADKDCQFKQVNDIMLACRRVGYADVQLRAIVQASATK